VQLGKQQRNDVFRALTDGGLKADECTLKFRADDILIAHSPSGSHFIMRPGFGSLKDKSDNVYDADSFGFRTKVWSDPERAGVTQSYDPYDEVSHWGILLGHIREWAAEVVAWTDIPDYWAR
jgi:hypothetical protein